MKTYKEEDIRQQFQKETGIAPVFANRLPYIAYIQWLESKILTQINKDGKRNN